MTPDALARTHLAANTVDRPWTASEFADLLASPGALLTGEPAAFVLGRVVLDEAEILTLATHPDRQRRGLMRRALHDFLRRAAARGATRAFLDVAEDNAAACALYLDAGFVEVARRPRYFTRPDGAVAAIVMTRDPIAVADGASHR